MNFKVLAIFLVVLFTIAAGKFLYNLYISIELYLFIPNAQNIFTGRECIEGTKEAQHAECYMYCQRFGQPGYCYVTALANICICGKN